MTSIGPITGTRRDVVNVVDFGAQGNGTTDDSAAINAAIAAASSIAPASVYLPVGVYRVVSSINIVSGVRIYGDGPGRTVVKPVGLIQAFYGLGLVGTPLTDVTIERLEIDGSLHAGGYTSAMKGIQANYCLRHIYRDLYVHDCGATGVGSDYLVDSLFENVVADSNGRLGTVSSAGAAGIGIGTGAYAVETLTVIDCTTRNNARDGLLFENQSGLVSIGSRVINHVSSGNGEHGIADAGVGNLKVIGGQTSANGGDGFAAYKGTYAGATGPGTGGMVIGLESYSNTGNGLHIDATVNPSGDYTFVDCKSHDNTLHGLLLDVGAAAYAGLKVRGGAYRANQLNGLYVTTTGGAVSDIVIDGPECYDNGKNTGGGAALRHGISIGCSVGQFRLVNARCWDSQGVKTQQYGLYLPVITLTGGVADNNDFCQNAVASNVSIAATFSSYRIGFNNGWTIWTGSPESAVTAGVGTLFRRLDGGAGTSLYVKESGSGNTGWVGK